MATDVDACARRVLAGGSVGRDEALALLEAAETDPWPLLFCADRVRAHCRGRRVHLCGIAAVKVGRCGEDCRWCAQSAHWHTNLEPRGLLATEEILRAAQEARANGAASFGLVSSGAALSDAELDRMAEAAEAVRSETGLDVCASFGALRRAQAQRLAGAGIVRCNHNIETSARYFPNVCTTHTYEDRMRTARAVRDAGLELCCGGIFGIGEADADRVNLALALADLAPEVVPLNFLHPIPGTPLADAEPLAPMKVLSIIATFRLILPRARIKVAGGRERSLRDLQSLMFLAGADGCLIGNYLTTAGRPADEDLAMIRDLGFVPAGVGERAPGASP
jgi:biotin synthase